MLPRARATRERLAPPHRLRSRRPRASPLRWRLVEHLGRLHAAGGRLEWAPLPIQSGSSPSSIRPARRRSPARPGRPASGFECRRGSEGAPRWVPKRRSYRTQAARIQPRAGPFRSSRPPRAPSHRTESIETPTRQRRRAWPPRREASAISLASLTRRACSTTRSVDVQLRANPRDVDVRSSHSFRATVRCAASIPSFAGITRPESMSISASS